MFDCKSQIERRKSKIKQAGPLGGKPATKKL